MKNSLTLKYYLSLFSFLLLCASLFFFFKTFKTIKEAGTEFDNEDLVKRSTSPLDSKGYEQTQNKTIQLSIKEKSEQMGLNEVKFRDVSNDVNSSLKHELSPQKFEDLNYFGGNPKKKHITKGKSVEQICYSDLKSSVCSEILSKDQDDNVSEQPKEEDKQKNKKVHIRFSDVSKTGIYMWSYSVLNTDKCETQMTKKSRSKSLNDFSRKTAVSFETKKSKQKKTRSAEKLYELNQKIVIMKDIQTPGNHYILIDLNDRALLAQNQMQLIKQAKTSKSLCNLTKYPNLQAFCGNSNKNKYRYNPGFYFKKLKRSTSTRSSIHTGSNAERSMNQHLLDESEEKLPLKCSILADREKNKLYFKNVDREERKCKRSFSQQKSIDSQNLADNEVVYNQKACLRSKTPNINSKTILNKIRQTSKDNDVACPKLGLFSSIKDYVCRKTDSDTELTAKPGLPTPVTNSNEGFRELEKEKDPKFCEKHGITRLKDSIKNLKPSKCTVSASNKLPENKRIKHMISEIWENNQIKKRSSKFSTNSMIIRMRVSNTSTGDSKNSFFVVSNKNNHDSQMTKIQIDKKFSESESEHKRNLKKTDNLLRIQCENESLKIQERIRHINTKQCLDIKECCLSGEEIDSYSDAALERGMKRVQEWLDKNYENMIKYKNIYFFKESNATESKKSPNLI